uniref:PDZ domain-containing protein n=1 Tax=Anopheles minimus TaxID=112268 RepID=A0A182VVF4_9DIPT
MRIREENRMKKKANIFELPPKCPALASKITGIFGWRHTYQVHQRQKSIPHCSQYLYKSYSLNLPRKMSSYEALETGSDGTLCASGGDSKGGGRSVSSSTKGIVYRYAGGGSNNCCCTEPGTPNCETNPDSWVVVHHLQSQAGILDPEDHISDVADDREEIIAHYEDAAVSLDPGVQQGGGDGASGSSVGTGSPDIFQTSGPGNKGTIGGVGGSSDGGGGGGESLTEDSVGMTECATVADISSNTDGVVIVGGSVPGSGVPGPGGGRGASCIEVFPNEPAPLGLGLQVRRGSEPSLHQIGVTEQRSPLYNVNPNGNHQGTSKRWSAAPVCRSDSDPPPDRLLTTQQNGGGPPYLYHNHTHLLAEEWNVTEEDGQQQQDSLLPQIFNRSGRLSMQFLGAEASTGFRWMDAAEKAAAATASTTMPSSTNSSTEHNQSSPAYGYQTYQNYMQQQQLQNHSFHSGSSDSVLGRGGNNSFNSKSLPRESTRKEPLGQAKASVYDSLREKDSEMLLVVNENGGPLGLTAIPDMERGGLLVQSVEPGSRAERGRLRRGDRILEINNIKLVGLSESSVQEHLKKSLASTELRLRVVRGSVRHRAGVKTDQYGGVGAGRLVKSGSGSRNPRDNRVGQMMIEAEEKPTSAAKVATVSPTRKIPGAPSTGTSLQVANTRKLGKRIEITLTKGDHGLGFSVTTRDNPAGGHCPIYIKNILPKGAAVEDGRLKPGDRLLEVEGIPMTGKSQTEVVSILRGTPHGATLKIIVSRQQELAVDVKEREIGYNVESEPKNSPPKPPPPVMPKSSLKQSNSNNSLSKSVNSTAYGDGTEGGNRTSVGNYRSMPKLASGTVTASSPKTPTIQKKPLASILKSASTNLVAELLQHQQHDTGGGNGRVDSGASAGSNISNVSMTSNNSSSVGGESLCGSAWKNREILTLHIPVHDTEKAGLGVSVKGKTGSGNCSSSTTGSCNGSSIRTDGDLGIFVKSVLHGGAASRDGRLKMNDQLLSVNGVSLLGQSNAEAMDTLRRAMLQSGGNYPGKIILKIARRIARPVSTGELLETMEQRLEAVSNSEDHPPGGGHSGTTVIYLSADKQPQRSTAQQQNHLTTSQQQSKRYSNPVLDRLTGGSTGTISGNSNSNGSLQHSSSQQLGPTAGGGNNDIITGSHYIRNSSTNSSSSTMNSQQQQNHAPNNQRPSAQRSFVPSASSLVHSSSATHGLRNESYYMATKDHWSTSSATSLNGSNVVLIEEDPEPISPTFHIARSLEGSAGGVVGSNILVNGNTSTPNGADATYASQLSLETNPPPSDAFSRDAIGRRSMSEKHHAAMDARETGTYQRNKKLREKRDRDSKLLMASSTAMTSSGGSLESIDLHQMARMNSLKEQQQRNQQQHGEGGGKGTATAALAANLLRAEAQDQLGDLGPSLGMKKSSSLESLQTMVQEIQMADEPRGPNALRTPRGRGREEILRAVVEQPAETQAKKHWLLEDGPPASMINSGEFPDGGFVSRNSPFQSSLNDGKGTKLRGKKSGGLLRGIGHMFRFGKHRKDVIVPTSSVSSTGSGDPVIDYTAPTIVASQQHTTSSGGGVESMVDSNNCAGMQKNGGSNTITKRGTLNMGAAGNNSSRYIVFDPSSVERSASSGVVYGHAQPPHYQPPPPPPVSTGGGPSGTSIHHTDVFNHRYSHYVNYEELQQHISSVNITLEEKCSSSKLVVHGANSEQGMPCISRRSRRPLQRQQHHVYEQIQPSTTSNRLMCDSISSNQSRNGTLKRHHNSLVAHDGTVFTPELLERDHRLLQLHQLWQLQQWQWLQQLENLHEREQEQLLLLRRVENSRRQQRSICNKNWQAHDVGCDGILKANADVDAKENVPDCERNVSSKPTGTPSHETFANSNGSYQWQFIKPSSVNRRHHLYHSQRSARNTSPMMDIGLIAQQQQQKHQYSSILSNQQSKYKSNRPVSSYHDGGGYETISITGQSATVHQRNDSCSGSGETKPDTGALLHEETNGGDWHHHQGNSGAGGSIRNMRGPFVTQVKIQNQISYQ